MFLQLVGVLLYPYFAHLLHLPLEISEVVLHTAGTFLLDGEPQNVAIGIDQFGMLLAYYLENGWKVALVG